VSFRAPEFVRAASDELREAAGYYEQRRPKLGIRFLDAVEKTLQRLAGEPLLGSPLRGAIRRQMVGGFPYALIYRADSDPIRILAVAHVRRRPGYWHGRR
jgi:plasmid stabilization system protein ParE